MDDTCFQDAIKGEAEAIRCAREILGIDEDSSPEETKAAWRRACRETHPDQNPGDSDGHRRFILVNCAYRLLRGGVPCNALLDEIGREAFAGQESRYDLHNPWGMFVWWREKIF